MSVFTPNSKKQNTVFICGILRTKKYRKRLKEMFVFTPNSKKQNTVFILWNIKNKKIQKKT